MSPTKFPASPATRDTRTPVARLSRGWRRRRPIILAMSVTLAAVGISGCADQSTAPSIAPLQPSITSERDAKKMRGARPFVFTNLREGKGVDEIARFIEQKGGLGK